MIPVPCGGEQSESTKFHYVILITGDCCSPDWWWSSTCTSNYSRQPLCTNYLTGWNSVHWTVHRSHPSPSHWTVRKVPLWISLKTAPQLPHICTLDWSKSCSIHFREVRTVICSRLPYGVWVHHIPTARVCEWLQYVPKHNTSWGPPSPAIWTTIWLQQSTHRTQWLATLVQTFMSDLPSKYLPTGWHGRVWSVWGS